MFFYTMISYIDDISESFAVFLINYFGAVVLGIKENKTP
ncbi:hypothetical protein yfred0001_8090 [Yersinia frederiksenii ATCC 33641]|nr:hypothetical protein yfred0001_8090 [Yersinia frederiksenii ATCC 33641]